jgi:hypothetical protein
MNRTNHPYTLRAGGLKRDCYFYVLGLMLNLPPDKAPIRSVLDYKEWLRLTSLGINRL